MATTTPAEFRNLVIYSAYVRSHGPLGRFSELEEDLARIKKLGADVVWLMPIHPIGKLKAKGSLGCPYSISDFRGINPEYGTKEDFARLLKRAHDLGLKVIIDVVYHHTSHDSNLIAEHPEWYRQNDDGTPQTSVPEWSDIIDLNHPQPQLSEYLIGSLRQWVEMGVDGFRCDVASLIPVEFWKTATTTLRELNPNLIWLAESVYPDFVRERRQAGRIAFSDSEIFESFDILYDYDIWFMFRAVLEGRMPLARYLELLALQDAIYPANYCKLRFVENHDQRRIMSAAPSTNQALAWTAFQAFNKGPFMVYAGQESKATDTPSLFERETIDWGNYEFAPLLTKLAELKKDSIQKHGSFAILAAEPCLQACWSVEKGDALYGLFNVGAVKGGTPVQLPDGNYVDQLSGALVKVRSGQVEIPESAQILRAINPPGFVHYVPECWRQ